MHAAVARGAVAAVLAAAGCVEAFDGSNVQIDFNSGVQANTRPGGTPRPDQPPADTHYELYAVDLEYELDDNGEPVLDSTGQPIIAQTFLFEVQRFTIRSPIDLSSPCFIDIENTRFPGIHVTEYARAVREEVGVAIGENPGTRTDLTREQVIDVLTADRRHDNLEKIESEMKAVVSHAAFRYPAVDTVCADDAGALELAIPPIACTDARSNAKRLDRCRAAWASEPGFYEGSDKVFNIPLSGTIYGMVEGMNPINGGFVGGSGFFVPANLVKMDAYLLNWQFDDLGHDGMPDIQEPYLSACNARPPPFDQDPCFPTGFPYLQGRPVSVTRGTITVPLRHATNASITATMAIFPNLGSDDVNF